MRPDITLRPCQPEDEEFLFRVYASTREELALVDWTEAQKEQFLRQQFHAQHTFYHTQFSDAQFDVILRDGVPVGRHYVHRRPDEIRLVDLALLPEHRNHGIGGHLLRSLVEEVRRTQKPARFHVERENRARLLYERLGFRIVADKETYFLLELRPEDAGTTES